MIKLAVLVALLGVSSVMGAIPQWWKNLANQNSGFRYPETDSKVLWEQDKVQLSHFFEADAGFGTVYQGSDSNDSDDRVEAYGVNIWSYAKYQVFFICNNWFSQKMELNLEPVFVVPYLQRISWTRFEGEDGFAMGI